MGVTVVGSAGWGFQADMVGEVVDGGGQGGVEFDGFGAVGSFEYGVSCSIGSFFGGDEVNNGSVQFDHGMVAGLGGVTGLEGCECVDGALGGVDGFVEHDEADGVGDGVAF